MTYTLYSRSCGRVLNYFIYVWNDGSVHAGWSALMKYARVLGATEE